MRKYCSGLEKRRDSSSEAGIHRLVEKEIRIFLITDFKEFGFGFVDSIREISRSMGNSESRLFDLNF